MSSADESPAQPPELKSDEEWKERVRAENAALDEAFRKEQTRSTDAAAEGSAATEAPRAAPAEPPPEVRRRQPLPPVDFAALVTMFSTQAMVALGFLAHPASGKPAPNRDLAKHFIDLLGLVEEKTQGNLDPRERSLLDSTLHELRMAFVQMGEKS